MNALNTTILLFDPIILQLHMIIDTIKYLVGGVFGAYLFLLIMNWYKTRKINKEIRQIHREVSEINLKLDSVLSVKKQMRKKAKKK